jgi:hypothetical protein
MEASVASPQEAEAEESIPNPILDMERTVLASAVDGCCGGCPFVVGAAATGVECCGRLAWFCIAKFAAEAAE